MLKLFQHLSTIPRHYTGALRSNRNRVQRYQQAKRSVSRAIEHLDSPGVAARVDEVLAQVHLAATSSLSNAAIRQYLNADRTKLLDLETSLRSIVNLAKREIEYLIERAGSSAEVNEAIEKAVRRFPKGAAELRLLLQALERKVQTPPVISLSRKKKAARKVALANEVWFTCSSCTLALSNGSLTTFGHAVDPNLAAASMLTGVLTLPE